MDKGIFEKVCGFTVFAPCTDEANRSGDDPADQQLVIEHRRSALLVRIDLHMLSLQALAAVIGALSQCPLRFPCLGEMPL